MYDFYLSCPSSTFALHDGCFVPREWLATKCLFKRTFETLLNGLLGERRKWPLVEKRAGGGGESEYPAKNLWTKGENQNKLNPHIASTPGFEHGPQCFHHYSTFAPHARLKYHSPGKQK